MEFKRDLKCLSSKFLTNVACVNTNILLPILHTIEKIEKIEKNMKNKEFVDLKIDFDGYTYKFLNTGTMQDGMVFAILQAQQDGVSTRMAGIHFRCLNGLHLRILSAAGNCMLVLK